MFELTPQGPALLDGASTFQLVLWDGSVRAGTRIRVHVEASSGAGEQVWHVLEGGGGVAGGAAGGQGREFTPFYCACLLRFCSH